MMVSGKRKMHGANQNSAHGSSRASVNPIGNGSWCAWGATRFSLVAASSFEEVTP